MNQTPRAWNRLLIGIAGLIFLVLGAGVIAVLSVPVLKDYFNQGYEQATTFLSDLFTRTTLEGQRDSWLWIAIAAALLIIVIVMIVWIASQGKGRTGTLHDGEEEGSFPGQVRVSASVAEQLLKQAISGRTEVANVSTSTWIFKKTPCLKVRVTPRAGVSPAELGSDVTDLVRNLDAELGIKVPVLISMASGARARMGQEPVR